MKVIRPEDTDALLLKALLYGPPGSTKTRTSATAAADKRTSPVLHIDMGGNPLSIRTYRERPDVISAETFVDLNNAHRWLAAGQPQRGQLYEMLGSPKEPYKTVTFDGITTLQRRVMSRATGNDAKDPADVLTAAEYKHHGTVLMQMIKFAEAFFILPMHVIITALEYEQQDSGGAIYYRPQLTGQAASEVPAYAYLVGRMMHVNRVAGALRQAMSDEITGDTVSVMLLQPSSRWYAKNQYCAGEPYIVDPTVTKIMDLIAGD